MKTRGLLAVGFLLACASAHAQAITVQPPQCLPQEDNGVVRAALSTDVAGQAPRLYFRWKGQTDFYWVAMEAEPGRKYWGIPAKAEKRNPEVEYYVALVDTAGKIVNRSETHRTKVDPGCRAELSPKERGVAENLTVGETSPEQQGEKVVGFLCKGIVTRINSQGIRRTDEICGPCAVVWWQKAAPGAVAAGVVGVIVTDKDPDPSPSRP